jgi:hypothetical protein
MNNEEGIKHDEDKLRFDLIPIETLDGVAEVFTFGAKKYKENNWKLVSPKERFYSAALRHIFKHQQGEILDKESKLPHLDHAISNLIIYRELTIKKKGE